MCAEQESVSRSLEPSDFYIKTWALTFKILSYRRWSREVASLMENVRLVKIYLLSDCLLKSVAHSVCSTHYGMVHSTGLGASWARG